MSRPAKIVIWCVIAALVIYAALAFDIPYRNKVDDFDTCAATGNLVMESFPRKCRDAKGNVYTEVIESGTTTQMVVVDSPLSGAKISSPVKITGKARGTWYFEASFPVEVVAVDGTILGSGVAQAKGDWMTQDFVPFEASVRFASSATTTEGVIRLKKDNPSGDPARDEQTDVPVTFATSSASTKK